MLKTVQSDKYLIVYLKGRLDVHASSEIESEINELLEKYKNLDLIINLLDVEYMSSSGLRVLVATMRILKSSGQALKLCNLNAAVKKVFEVVELMDMFDIYDSEKDAIAES